MPGRGAAVFAGGDAGERHQLTPAEGGARGGEFFGHGAVVFLGVERAVFAHGVAQQQVEHRTRGVAEFAVAAHDGRGVGLEVLADGFIGFAQERVGLGGFDLVEMPLHRQRRPVQEIAAARGAVEGDLIRAENEAGEGVSGVAHAGQVAPGARRIAGMHADAVAVDAAERFARRLSLRRPAPVAQDKLIGRERNRFADRGGRKTFGERGGGGFGGLFGCGFENGLAEFIHPFVFGGASAGRAVQGVCVVRAFSAGACAARPRRRCAATIRPSRSSGRIGGAACGPAPCRSGRANPTRDTAGRRGGLRCGPARRRAGD